MIAITGATGQIGSRVATRLADLGIAHRLIVRDPTRAPRLLLAEVVQASSYGDAAGMRRALTGVEKLFLVSARDRFGVNHIRAQNHKAPIPYNRLQQHMSAIDAALAAGVSYILYLSVIHAARDAVFILAHDHFHTEEYIRKSGIAFTFIRASLYADNVPQYVSEDDTIRAPAGEGRVAWVTRDDIADTAVAILTGTGHVGHTYDITGPEALTMAETADCLSAALGRKITYRPQSAEEARLTRSTSRLEKFEAERRSLIGQGLDDYEVEVFVSHFLQIARGDLANVSDAVPKLTGHPAQSLAQFLETHPESYRHLVKST